MPTIQDRLSAALERLATGTSVHRSRAYDQARAARNGAPAVDERIEAAVVQFEAAADELWGALGLKLVSTSERVRDAA